MRRLAAALGVLLASCAGEAIAPSGGGSPCAGLREPVAVGALSDPVLGEVSGLAASRSHPGILWVHNDSDARPVLWAITTAGDTVATLQLEGAEAVDWEAASLGPGPGGDYLYVADTGDNLAARPHAVLYRLPEPQEPSGDSSAPAESVRLTYPGGPENVEAMFVDPESGDAYLLSKELLAPAVVYRVPAAAWQEGEAVAERVATLAVGLLPATAADLSSDGTVLAVRTYTTVLLFRRPAGAPISAIFSASPCRAPAPPEAQGEAIAWDGGGFLTIGEGIAAPVYRVSR